MLVTDDRLLAGRDPVELARRAVAGGVTSVQLRLKQASARELTDLARRLVQAVSVPVLVNDRPDVALASGAGVHLGPEDLPVDLARRILPVPNVIGASVGSQAEAGPAADADYWGIGPWRQTGTKQDAGGAIGADGFRRVVALARGRPCIAIGGIQLFQMLYLTFPLPRSRFDLPDATGEPGTRNYRVPVRPFCRTPWIARLCSSRVRENTWCPSGPATK
jgi:thiamine-phosphate pyrophosphorylase